MSVIQNQQADVVRPCFWKKLIFSNNQEAKNQHIIRISAYAKKVLASISRNDPVEKRIRAFKYAENVVERYKNNKKLFHIISRLDQYIIKKRADLWPTSHIKPEEYQLESHQEAFSKWLRYGFDEKIFIYHPEFALFLIKTNIASAMAMWGDQVAIINNKPHILVGEKLVNWEIVKNSIYIKFHRETQTHRLYEKKGHHAVQYLGAGQGLVRCNRYKPLQLPVVHHIDTKELKHLQSLAHKYLRPGEIHSSSADVQKSRNYILQVVTMNRPKKTGGKYSKQFKEPEHTFLRLITPDGDVTSVGLTEYNNNHNLFWHGRGSLDSPDWGDQVNSVIQYVTNIAISIEEAKQLETICQKLACDSSLVYNRHTQNCTSFVKFVLKELKITNPPEREHVFTLLSDLCSLPKTVSSTVQAVAKTVFNALLKPVTFLLGDRPFTKFSEIIHPSENKMTRLFRWFRKPLVVDFPFQIQEWQKTASTSTETLYKHKKVVISSLSKETKKEPETHGFGTPVILDKKSRTTFKHYALHPEIIRHNEQKGPKLGAFVKTDVRVTNKAEDSFNLKMKLLQSAQQSIDISFNYAGGEHFDDILKLVEEKLAFLPQFKVHFIVSRDLLDRQHLIKMKKLKEHFGSRFNYLITGPILSVDKHIRNEENHAKIMVIDGKYFVIGGSGIHNRMDRETLPKNTEKDWVVNVIDRTFRDSDIFGYGIIAESMRGQIYNLYQLWAQRLKRPLGPGEGMYTELDPTKIGRCAAFHEKEGLIEDASLSFLVGGPEHRLANPITRALVDHIDQASHDIQIANLYFNPDPKIKEALKRAKQRNVHVTGHFNGMAKGSSPIHYNYIFTNRGNYKLLNKAFEHQVPDQLYHKKVTTFDDTTAVIGSFNFGQKSALCDNESVVIVKDPRVVTALKNGILVDRQKSKEIALDSPQFKQSKTTRLSPLYGKLGTIIA